MTKYRPRHWTPSARKPDTRPSPADRGYDRQFIEARKAVLDQETECAICGRPATPADVVDHIQPLRHGGTSERRNLQRVCRKCNAAKAVIQNSRKTAPSPSSRVNGVMK